MNDGSNTLTGSHTTQPRMLPELAQALSMQEDLLSQLRERLTDVMSPSPELAQEKGDGGDTSTGGSSQLSDILMKAQRLNHEVQDILHSLVV